MPQSKSCKKRIKTNEKARVRNRAVKTRVKGAIKKVNAAGSKEEADKAFKEASSVLDSAARRGVLHRNKVARQKSRLAKKVKARQ